MVRWLSLAAFVVLLGLSWFIFELQNVWPFNYDRIVTLRALFDCLALLAAFTFLFGRWRLLPAALLGLAFVTTTALSNAVIDLPYPVFAGAMVLLVAVVSRSFGTPLNVR